MAKETQYNVEPLPGHLFIVGASWGAEDMPSTFHLVRAHGCEDAIKRYSASGAYLASTSYVRAYRFHDVNTPDAMSKFEKVED